MNDGYFDFGSLAGQQGLSTRRARCELYFGEPARRAPGAGSAADAQMSDAREGMWGLVQGTSASWNSDYGAYAEEHFSRLRTRPTTPGCRRGPVTRPRECRSARASSSSAAASAAPASRTTSPSWASATCVLVERAELTSGSTFHSAGLVGQLRADPTLTRMNMYSVELYRRLPPRRARRRLDRVRRHQARVHAGAAGGDPAADRLGARRSACRCERDLAAGGARAVPAHRHRRRASARRTCRRTATSTRRSSATRWPTARARGGVQIAPHTRVDRASTSSGGRVRGVRTDRGDIECEVVVNCGGMFAAEIGRLAGVRVPIVPMSHQYVVTEPFRDAEPRHAPLALPTLRDPDLLVYFRQEVDGLVMGGYERDPRAVDRRRAASTRSRRLQRPAAARGLGPASRRSPTNRAARVPAMADVGVRRSSTARRPSRRTTSSASARPRSRGFFVAAGFCAHGIAGAGGIGKVMAEWIVDGEPGVDLWHMDVRRFGRAVPLAVVHAAPGRGDLRDLLRHPLPRPRAARGPSAADVARVRRGTPPHGAEFGEKSGWERVNWYESNAAVGDDGARPRGWAGKHWSPGDRRRAPRRTRGRRRCSTSRRSRSSRSPDRTPPRSSSGCATTRSRAASGRSRTPRC